MNLQFFAEGDNNGDVIDDDGSGGGNNSNNNNMSLDDFLQGEGNQAEFDRRVNKSIQSCAKCKREMGSSDK